MRSIHVGIDTLTIKDLVELSEDDAYVELSKKSIDQVEQSAEFVDAIIENGKITYGINTGFGPLCNTIISKEDTSKLQDNILRSHSVGVGNPIEPKIAKMMLVLKLQALSMGFSGVQKTTLQRIEFFINHNIIPVVPEQGSVGASGDLAPLAHLFLPLIGLGEVYYQGAKIEASKMYQLTGLKPLVLKAKEGLALINGTQFIAAHAAIGVYRMQQLLDIADIIGAMSLEGVLRKC